MSKKPKYTYSIIYADEDDSFFSHGFSIIYGHGTATTHESTTVNPYNDRAFFTCRFCTCPYIEIQAIFTDGLLRNQEFFGPHAVRNRFCLHGTGTKTFTFANAFPGLHRLWLLPSKIAHRGSRKRNTLKRIY